MKILPNFDENSDAWDPITELKIPLESHKFDEKDCSLKILDQLLLPNVVKYLEVVSVEDGFNVIKNMQVRGAPLIATIAMLSLLSDIWHTYSAQKVEEEEGNVPKLITIIKKKCDYLLDARPTAINLSKALTEMKNFLDSKSRTENFETFLISLKEFILTWQRAEKKENDLLVRNSIFCLRKVIPKERLTVMTICNTGSLATSSFGTALGVIVHLHRLGYLELALVLETRPYNQGSRLTTLELITAHVPFRLIADSAAASAMRHYSVDAILVGADQVTKTGDTANKIGTYSLAVLAQHHQIPFFVVTPTSSINLAISSAEEIKIEERPAKELTMFNGIGTCPENCPVWNPAFDVTPAPLIYGILTEHGNFVPSQLSENLTTQTKK